MDSNQITEDIYRDRIRDAQVIPASNPAKSYNTSSNSIVYINGNIASHEWSFFVPIPHALAKIDKPLPPGVPYEFTFNRAKKKRSVITVPYETWKKFNKDSPVTKTQFELLATNDNVDLPSIIIKECEIHVAYLNSYEESQKYHTTIERKIPFESYATRRIMLPANADEHDICLSSFTTFPKRAYFAIIDPDREEGQRDKSVGRFVHNDIKRFSLLIDGYTMKTYPLEIDNIGRCWDFFYKYSRQTNGFYNDLSYNHINYRDFVENNFCVIESMFI